MPISGKANKHQRLFTADEVLDDLDNSDDEQELNSSYPDSELESESSDSDNKKLALTLDLVFLLIQMIHLELLDLDLGYCTKYKQSH